jgi:hypothetical protein
VAAPTRSPAPPRAAARVALAPAPSGPAAPDPPATPPPAPVLVTIGRVEVRVVPPPARPAERRRGQPQAGAQAPSLADYLARLDRGGRR